MQFVIKVFFCVTNKSKTWRHTDYYNVRQNKYHIHTVNSFPINQPVVETLKYFQKETTAFPLFSCSWSQHCKMHDTYHLFYPPDPDKYRLMRVNCTDCNRCMRLTNSFNSLRLHGQQEMEYKHRRVPKVSAIKHWTNTLLCFTDGIACVPVGLLLCACIYKWVCRCVDVCVCDPHLPSRTHQPQYGSFSSTHDWQSFIWRHVCTGTLVIWSITTWNTIRLCTLGGGKVHEIWGI